MSVSETLQNFPSSLTSAETRVFQTLMIDFPVGALGPASRLAKRAKVSDPTVSRLISKLGWESYAEFQIELLSELSDRLLSPLMMMETKSLQSGSGPQTEYFDSIGEAVRRTATSTGDQTYVKIAKLLIEAKGAVWLVGGRFSTGLALILDGYMTQMRPRVHHIGPLSSKDFDRLADISKRDVVVIFDYRRYQRDIVDFASQARERGAAIVLFTDPWFSPVASFANITLVAQVEAASPFDTMAPALAQLEKVALFALDHAGASAKSRMETIDALRNRNQVTLDAAEIPAFDDPVE